MTLPGGTDPATVVIGAAGFLGANLARRLSPAAQLFTRSIPFCHNGSPHPALSSADVVFYLASRISPAVAERSPDLVLEDLRTLRCLLDCLRANPRRPLVVLASSGGALYDPQSPPPYTEFSPLIPASAYARAKWAQERLLAHSLDWTTPVSLRLSNVYGPGQRTSAGYGVVGHWMEAMRAGQPVTILGSPAARRDYLHVSDAVAALLAVRSRFARLRLSAAPVVLNVGSGVPTSLAELHLLLEDVVGGPIRVSHRPARTFDRRDTWLDVTRATAVLDWAPAMSLTDGLADTWHSHAGAKLATSGQVHGRT